VFLFDFIFHFFVYDFDCSVFAFINISLVLYNMLFRFPPMHFYRIFIFLQLLSPLIVVAFLCPGANAVQNKQPFPDIPFKVFSTFIEENFSSKISLATVLMLLFTLNENTDLLNLHQQQQNPQLKKVEQWREISAWIKSLAHEIQIQTTNAKFKTFFKKFDVLHSLPDTEVIDKLGIKLNAFANMLGLKTYGSDEGFTLPYTFQLESTGVPMDLWSLWLVCGVCGRYWIADTEYYISNIM
jgi:hypothetical protein